MNHILFWAVFVLVNAFAWGFAENNTFRDQLINELWLLPVKLAIVYINLYYFLPQFLLRRRKLQYFGLLTGAYMAGTLLMRWTYLNFIAPGTQDIFFNIYRLFKYFLFDINFAVIITTGIRLFYYWYSQEQASRDLKEQKQEAEIKLLKSQVNPHFLFNTMNNLYSLTLHNNKKASEFVLRLSDIMRYMVYEGSKDFVLLKDEISYLRDYIAIERFRYGDELDLSFSVEGEGKDLVIAPLLLLPFIENIFKHSIEKDPEQTMASVAITISDEQLLCVFRNNKRQDITGSPAAEAGMGIENVKKRLQLVYPGKHLIKIDNSEAFFTVELKITLTNKNGA